MLELRCHQPPKPSAITPTTLHAQLRDHMIAEQVSKGRRACRIDRSLPKGIFDVRAVEEDSSATTVGLSQK